MMGSDGALRGRWRRLAVVLCVVVVSIMFVVGVGGDRASAATVNLACNVNENTTVSNVVYFACSPSTASDTATVTGTSITVGSVTWVGGEASGVMLNGVVAPGQDFYAGGSAKYLLTQGNWSITVAYTNGDVGSTSGSTWGTANGNPAMPGTPAAPTTTTVASTTTTTVATTTTTTIPPTTTTAGPTQVVLAGEEDGAFWLLAAMAAFAFGVAFFRLFWGREY